MSTPHNATLIRNGRVITASDDYVADVLLKDGIVHTIGQAIEVGPDVRVVDASGLLAAFLRMPGAPLHSVDIAIDKAYTAVSFGLPTHQWTEALQSHSAAVRDGLITEKEIENA